MRVLDELLEKIKGFGNNEIKENIERGTIGERESLMQEGTLNELVGEGYGLMGGGGYYGAYRGLQDVPEGMVEFIVGKFQEYNIIFPPELTNLARFAGMMGLSYAGNWDPYFLLIYSDVNESSEWMTHTFKVSKASLGPNPQDKIAEPEKVEVFKHVIDGDITWFEEFNKYVPHTGMFEVAAHIIEDYMQNYIPDYFNDYLQEIGGEELLKSVCVNPETGESNVREYVELAFLSSLIWLASPLARQFRYEEHEIFYYAYRDGETICYDGSMYTKEEYIKVPLPPKSCMLCGIDSWCTEIIHGYSGDTVMACNGCVSKGRPSLPEATCGSLFCKHIECPHHKYAGMGKKGRYAMMHEGGGLRQLGGLNQEMPTRLNYGGFRGLLQ